MSESSGSALYLGADGHGWHVAGCFMMRDDVPVERRPAISVLHTPELRRMLDPVTNADAADVQEVLERVQRGTREGVDVRLSDVRVLNLHVGGALLLSTVSTAPEARVFALLPEFVGLLLLGARLVLVEQGLFPMVCVLDGAGELIAFVVPLQETLAELDAQYAADVEAICQEATALADVRSTEGGDGYGQ